MPQLRAGTGRPRLITIPSSDQAFATHVEALVANEVLSSGDLQARLRRMFPRVVVRERTLSSEPMAWYVYRDGSWRSPTSADWWIDETLPQVVVSRDGWLVSASATAAGFLAFDPAQASDHHFTDFIAPGTLDDSLALFGVVERGHALTATVLMRPTTGDVIAVELHASKVGDDIVGVMRLADDVDVPTESVEVEKPSSVVTLPSTDAAFRAYVLRALARMSEPTPAGLALRTHRIYPHAVVTATADGWVVEREPEPRRGSDETWWSASGLPRVRFDKLAFILEANVEACELLGHELAGHHWQDFVIPGSSDEVAIVLEILARAGEAESRFRMPRSDGTLVEFDTYTTVDGENFVTVMRPAASR